MSWEDTNPPEQDEPELCGGCGYELKAGETFVCAGCSPVMCSFCMEFYEDCECDPQPEEA